MPKYETVGRGSQGDASVYDSSEDDEMRPMAVVGRSSSGSSGAKSHNLCVSCCTVFVLALLAVLTVAVGGDTERGQRLRDLLCGGPEICQTAACVHLASQLLDNMNTTIEPCDDFFEYSCGGWMEKNPIPDDKLRYSTFDQLRDKAQQVLRTELQRSSRSGASRNKAVTYFQACTDERAIEAAGGTPLMDLIDLHIPELTASADGAGLDVSSFRALATSLAALHSKGISAFFGLGISADDYDSEHTAVFLNQDGLSLPSREYYVGKSLTEDRSLILLSEHIVNAMKLACRGSSCTVASDQQWTERARAVVSVESSLASAMVSNTELRDPERRYNSLTLTELAALMPHFPWTTYLDTLFGPASLTRIVASSSAFLRDLENLLSTSQPQAISDYLRWQTIRMALPHLSTPFTAEADRFRKELYGSSPRPRWDLCVSRTDGAFGFALSELYVRTAFADGSKASAESMIEGIRAAFEAGLPELAWMDTETATAARAKAEAVDTKIGFPPFILNASALTAFYNDQTVLSTSQRGAAYFANVLAAAEAATARNLAKVRAYALH